MLKNRIALVASAVAMVFVVMLTLSAAAGERAGGGDGAGTGSAAQQTGSIVGWGSQVVVPQDELTDLVSVAAGGSHSLGLRADGSIVAWGSNDQGQSDVPSPNSDFIAVAAGNNHSLGLKADGSIVAWGSNNQGQSDVPSPNSDFVAVAGGSHHSLGLKADGSIVAWGNNGSGQTDVPSPNSDFIAVAAGWAYSLGLKADGSIVAWGYNAWGQTNVPSPNSDFIAVAAGTGHSLGLKADGSIVAWGSNNQGQSDVPSPNSDFVAVAAGNYHSLGLKADGSIVAWGSNNQGQIDVPSPNSDFVAAAGGGQHSLGLKADGSIVAWGRNNHGQSNVPSPNSDFVAVAAGSRHSLGLKADGSIVTWGWNDHGQSNVPSPNSDFVAVAGGSFHSMGLKADGSIVAWGANWDGQANVPSPNSDFVAVAGGGQHSLGLKADGSIVAWGHNGFGQSNVPSPNSDFVAVAAGHDHSLGLKADGSIVAWGWNFYGQTNVPSPNSDFVAVAAGGNHSLGLKADGSIVAWGRNNQGQTNVPSPNSDFVAVAGGSFHSLGLKADGSIVAWGSNSDGQTNVPSPNSDFVAVAGGSFHSLGIKQGDPACPPGEIPDCNGNCAPASWVGDGYCDDGLRSWAGESIYFNCEQYNNDGGDCDPDACPPGLIFDCNGNCAPAYWVGDGICDDGSSNYYEVLVDFDCEAFDFDGGDCDDPSDPFADPPHQGEPPSYPDQPEPKKKKLIYITHGFSTSSSKYNNFWNKLGGAIQDRVGPDWDVRLSDWTSASGWGLPCCHAKDANYALTMAFHTLGPQVANWIIEDEYEFVHFIAHSAGAGLISRAAAELKAHSQDIKIHTTYLDPFKGVLLGSALDYKQWYGANAEWSDHYYSRERPWSHWWCYVQDWPTGDFTQLYLPKSFNLDVSLVDPDYGSVCLSSHAWPYCFYNYTVDGSSHHDCEPPDGATLGYGFPLSYANWEGDVESWIDFVNAAAPIDTVWELPGGNAAVQQEPDGELVWRVRNDVPIELDSVPFNLSDSEAVEIADGIVTMTTQPAGWPEPDGAWVNFEIAVDKPVNFIRFKMNFISDAPAPDAAGLLSLYVNGNQRGMLDETYLGAGLDAYAMATHRVLEPGAHVVSFRLDHHGDAASTVEILSVATGLGKFVNIGDLNMDGVVDVSDLLILLANWGPCPRSGDCPADINGDGAVDVSDLLILLANWG